MGRTDPGAPLPPAYPGAQCWGRRVVLRVQRRCSSNRSRRSTSADGTSTAQSRDGPPESDDEHWQIVDVGAEPALQSRDGSPESIDELWQLLDVGPSEAF